jgi:hypothetical protein
MSEGDSQEWVEGPDDPRDGLIYFCGSKKKAQALPGVGLLLATITKGERPGMVSAKRLGDFHPWVYALAAIHYQRYEDRPSRVAASRCRRAYVLNFACPNGPESAQIELWGNPRGFEEFVGKAMARAFADHGAGEFEAIAKLACRIESADRNLDCEEAACVGAIINATQEAGSVPVKKVVRELWMDSTKGSEQRFKSILGRCGFSWLPTGKRGLAR